MAASLPVPAAGVQFPAGNGGNDEDGSVNFGTALKDWRVRRRISQLDLALRAGTTQRHVSFMESGRSLPGRGMVLRVAESLELPLRERNGLLYAAGFAPSYPETRLDDPAIRPVLDGLRRLLDGHRPYPAIVVDRYGVLVAANDAFGLLTEGVAPELLREPVDTLRLALHPEGMAPRVRNLDDWARHILERLRNDLARTPDDRLAAQLAELESYVPPPSPPGADHLGFAVPVRLTTSAGELRLITAITTFATAADVTVSELKLETFLPADAETAARLEGGAAVS
jgi:transcriptional regulator with XRE-family HTH domain